MFRLRYRDTASLGGGIRLLLFYGGSSSGQSQPFIEADTISGLVGSFEDSPIVGVGESGARYDYRDRVVHPIEGSFTVVVFSEQQWRIIHDSFSTRELGTLMFSSGDSAQADVWELPFRLSAPLATPASIPKAGARIVVNGISPSGVWTKNYSRTLPQGGNVTVTNKGDVPIWPTFEWEGATGGQITMYSGATFRVQGSIDGKYTLPMVRSNSGRVFRDGNYDPEATKKTNLIGECVPVGEMRFYSFDFPATLSWKEGVFNPWHL